MKVVDRDQRRASEMRVEKVLRQLARKVDRLDGLLRVPEDLVFRKTQIGRN